MDSKMSKTPYKYKPCISETEELITSVGRPSPSVVASATSSTCSVASTKPLIAHKTGLFLTTSDQMSQIEKNILMAPLPQLGNDEKIILASSESVRTERVNTSMLKQGLAAFSVSLCSAVVGFSSAYTSPALVSMASEHSRLHVTDQEASWIGSLMPLSALVGGAIGGPLIEILGRKTTIMATALPFILSFLLISFAASVPMIMAGRAIAGLAVGVSSLVLPVYLGETLQPEVRGTFGLFPTTIGNFGILLCFATGKYLDWTALALFGALLPLPYFILMFFVPETPRWYVGKGKTKKARKALHWLRGEDADVTEELNDLEKTDQIDESSSSSLKDLLQRRYIVPLGISMGLMFFQQMSGINAIIFYTVTIFKDAGSTIDSNLSAIIVGVVNLCSTLTATFLIDRLGRKILMYISNTLMALTLTTLGTFFYYKNNGADISQIGWIPLASFVIFVIGFSIGAGPIPWLMMGEILPAKIRGTAASLATAFNWTCTFIVTKTFVDMTRLLGAGGTFWAFGVISLIGLFFVIFFVPETQGKSLEDIERNFMGEKIPVRNVRRHSSIANLKPMPSSL